MKAAVLMEIGQPFVIKDVPLPQIGPDEVLVRTRACGLCRTDLHIQEGLAYVPGLPHVPGHEPSGIVVERGPRVTGIEVGQRVAPHVFASCGACAYCRTGRSPQCTNVDGVLGVTMWGGFAEYFKMPARNLLAVPDGVPLDVAGLASCAVVSAVHAYRKSGLRVHDAAVVLGAGGLGLVLVQILGAAGVRVAAVDRSEGALEAARRAGAALAIRAGGTAAAEQVRRFAGPSRDGARCVFDLVGTAETMRAAAEFVMRCGRIVVVGEEPEFPSIDTTQIAQRELEIVGSRNGGLQDLVDALDMMASGTISPVVDRRFGLDDFNEAMEHVRSGQAHGRVVITVGDETGGSGAAAG